MKNIIVIFMMGLSVLGVAAPPIIPDDPARALEWKDRRNKQISDIVNGNNDEIIPQLGQLLRQIARPIYRESSEKQEIVEIVKSHLIGIPGHAEYYRDKVNETYERSGKSSEFSREQSWSFQTLEQLPSPETVRVLGEFLYDERNEFVEDPELSADANDQRMIMSRTNAMHAMRALVKLIDNPPAPSTTRPRKADLNPWRLWYEQVKAGTRTIRFKGDPQEYNLDGPVRGAKHGPATNRTAKRDAAGGEPTEERETGFTPFRAILTGMAVLLCLWASWRWWKMRPELTK